LAFGDKIVKMHESTIDKMPYMVAIPAILVLRMMFYWLFRIYKGREILLSWQPFIGNRKKDADS
jgi:hypothetical protein